MAHALTLVDAWAPDLALATPHTPSDDVAGLSHLPTEWQVIDDVVLDDAIIDHVVIGPNGVFAVSIDPDPVPATVASDGLYRDGVRVTTTVKSAIMAAHDLRRRVGERMFAYPLLVTAIAEHGQLDRLGVVPGHRIPEAIWSHAGSPLTRTQRAKITWDLEGIAT